MPINFTNYVSITSGVGGGNSVRQRDLITRIFTENQLVPTGGFIEFTDIASVGAYFGTASVEYLRAQFYFGWGSKNITAPQKISFARWANVATVPQIFGDNTLTQALASWNSVTAGAFSLTMGLNSELGPDTHLVSGMDFSEAGSLSAVAAIVQAAIRAIHDDVLWTACTVVWDAANNRFTLSGGTSGAADISVTAGGGGSDIAAQLGWLSVNTILSDGADAQTITEVITASAAQSNNFGSFLFIPTLTQQNVVDLATWTDAQNVRYMFLCPVSATNAATYYGLIGTLGGTAMTLAPISTEYPDMIPGMILASTDYTARASVQNYMFQIFPGLTASVTDTLTAQTYDNERVNYYGNTETAGTILSFYQRGTLTGTATDPVDQNVYANEMWLKDAAGAAIMGLLLSLSQVPANKTGQAQILTTLQSVIDAALFNGTISVGKPLNSTQQLYVTNITGDVNAWQQVQNIGYWKGCVIESYVTEDNRTEWKAVYTLIYSKSDDIRFVSGSHILI